MYYPEKIKQAPIAGLTGFGGGASGLNVAGGGVDADPHEDSLYIAFPLWNGGSGSSLVMNNNYGSSTQTTSLSQRGTSSALVILNTSNHTTSEGGDSYGGSAFFDGDGSGTDDSTGLVSNVNDTGMQFHGDDAFTIMYDMKWNGTTSQELRVSLEGNNGWLDTDGMWFNLTNTKFTLARANHTGGPTYYHEDIGGNPRDGDWHQVACCYDGSGEVNFYVDGNKEATNSSVSTGTWASYDHSGVDGGHGSQMLRINSQPYPVAPGNSNIISYAPGEFYMNDLRIYTTDVSGGGAATIDVRKSILRYEGVV